MTADAVGGVWSYALTLAAALQATDVTLAVLGPAPSTAQRTAAAELPNLRLVEDSFRLEWMEDPWDDIARAEGWLLDLAAQHRPDIVHVNGYAHAAADWPAPVVVVAHSCVPSWWQAVYGEPAPAAWEKYRRRVAAGLLAADAVVAPTRTMLAALDAHYGWRGDGRVIANGCDATRFAPAPKEPLVLTAGRVWDEAKNIATLDRAAARLPWPVYVAGDCRHPERGIAALEHARALGRLPADSLVAWLGRAAIYASRARYEPFGLSILEAANAGGALVLGDIPSLRELWEGAALFVPPTDAEALAGAIASLIADPGRREALGLEARRRAGDFSAIRMARSYAALYEELLCRAAVPALATVR
jgi:glycosyltransferase involved in cell wall biosynthesis